MSGNSKIAETRVLQGFQENSLTYSHSVATLLVWPLGQENGNMSDNYGAERQDRAVERVSAIPT